MNPFANLFKGVQERAAESPAYKQAFLQVYNPEAYKASVQAQYASTAAQAQSDAAERAFAELENRGIDPNSVEGRNLLSRLYMTSANPDLIDHGEGQDNEWQKNVYSVAAPTGSMKEADLALNDPNAYRRLLAYKTAIAEAGANRSVTNNSFKFPGSMVGLDTAKSIIDKETGINISPGMSPDELNAGLASGKFAWGDSDKAGSLQSLNLAESNLKQMYNLYLEATDGMSQDPGLMGTYERAKFSLKGDLMKEAQGKVKVYRDLASAVAPALAQAMGQKGALSDGDITRAQQILSTLGGYTPSDLLDIDTRASATRKMNELMAIIQSAKQAKGGKPKQSRYHEYQDDLTGQWKVDRYYVPENGTEEILDEGFNIEGRL